MNLFYILPAIELAIGLSLGLFIYYTRIRHDMPVHEYLLWTLVVLGSGGILGLFNWFGWRFFLWVT